MAIKLERGLMAASLKKVGQIYDLLKIQAAKLLPAILSY